MEMAELDMELDAIELDQNLEDEENQPENQDDNGNENV